MAMNIPLIQPDLPPFELVQDSLKKVLESGKVTNFGEYVGRFEKEASEYLSAATATVSSCTAGLILALQAVGVGRGDKVIVPSFTFPATAQAVLYSGAIPIFAEIGEDLTIAPDDVAMLLDQHPDVRAVLAVHTYGFPCNTSALQKVVDEASQVRSDRIALVFDAAQAFGSAIGGERVGGFGDAEVFSFSATKLLVGIEGGMVSSRRPEIIHRIKRMRNYGIEAAYDTFWPGLNGKMSELHAIIALENLLRLDSLLDARSQRARYYRARLDLLANVHTLPWPSHIVQTFKDFSILIGDATIETRDTLRSLLGARGIETRAYFYPPVHQQHYFLQFADRPLPRTERIASSAITLPFFTTMTESQMDYVVESLSLSQAALNVS